MRVKRNVLHIKSLIPQDRILLCELIGRADSDGHVAVTFSQVQEELGFSRSCLRLATHRLEDIGFIKHTRDPKLQGMPYRYEIQADAIVNFTE